MNNQLCDQARDIAQNIMQANGTISAEEYRNIYQEVWEQLMIGVPKDQIKGEIRQAEAIIL